MLGVEGESLVLWRAVVGRARYRLCAIFFCVLQVFFFSGKTQNRRSKAMTGRKCPTADHYPVSHARRRNGLLDFSTPDGEQLEVPAHYNVPGALPR